ncbi:hypothetical protein AR457_36230 [Streptomyces agglomeratus]|uniref:Uncharacterized protein n=1 Tax=Streptomyces agglomeratus TaxID=285458 RepID=A0A1E5NYN1_9ACTN|nr:hypothetical protein AS594_37420 [Streptomyces agglomeratus]OEJ22732.1 hypothetical protein AR457_36230 [Streptomyces agglomeratus]OEJ36675.1 hypothetical protein BGK72_36600 [Streptomyces agglomeratus]OEJ56400.1 hypothetical protein BGM19_37525 [Streptomyces agglomeratus]
MIEAGLVRSGFTDVQQLTEYRYRAVREVLGGSPIGEVAVRYGMSRHPAPGGDVLSRKDCRV